MAGGRASGRANGWVDGRVGRRVDGRRCQPGMPAAGEHTQKRGGQESGDMARAKRVVGGEGSVKGRGHALNHLNGRP